MVVLLELLPKHALPLGEQNTKDYEVLCTDCLNSSL